MHGLRSKPYQPAEADSAIFSSTDYSESEAFFSDPADNTDRSSPPPPPSPPSNLNYSVVHPDELNEVGSPIPFASLTFNEKDDRHDPKYAPPEDRRPRLSDEEKVVEVLQSLNNLDSRRFSLPTFLKTLFTSNDPQITVFTNQFLAADGAIDLLNIWEARLKADQALKLASWAVEKAALVCAHHASLLTDQSYHGPFKKEAEYLRMPPAEMTLARLNEFSSEGLCKIYDNTMSPLQVILKAVMGKEGKSRGQKTRNPDAVRVYIAHSSCFRSSSCKARTYVTSVLLNIRTRRTNLHQQVLGVIAWRLGVKRRFIQLMNQLGGLPSYPTTIQTVKCISINGIQCAVIEANDNSTLDEMEYDNFNWRKIVHEAVGGRTDIQHDQVSALLISLQLPPGLRACDVASVAKFEACKGTRHTIPPTQSLLDVLPSENDEAQLRESFILHVATILATHVPALQHLSHSIPAFTDPSPIPPKKSRVFHLPTLDQEQGTVRGNMEVLETYLFEVLKIPEAAFEERMMAILGDRLTTARDRSAQAQRGLDRSKSRGKRFSSLVLLPGLMHTRLALVEVINRHLWHEGKAAPDPPDPADLSTLRRLLPHRTRVKHRKVDFYAWLRFLEVDLAALVIAAAGASLPSGSECTTLDDLERRLNTTVSDWTSLRQLSEKITDVYLTSSLDRLEAVGVKKVASESVVGHATLTMQLLMQLRELTMGIKMGHRGRIVRCLKYLYPIFYAGGSYNYAAEVGDLLHNIEHDWPKESVPVLVGGLVMNTSGRPDGFKDVDLGGEHYNGDIKEQAHGTNMTPQVLNQITPALGPVSVLADNLFRELGVERRQKRHAHVKATIDVHTLAKHLLKNHTLDFTGDQPATTKVPDFYVKGRDGLTKKGHARHLERHLLASRTRHDASIPGAVMSEDRVDEDGMVIDEDEDQTSLPDGWEIGDEDEVEGDNGAETDND